MANVEHIITGIIQVGITGLFGSLVVEFFWRRFGGKNPDV